MIHSASIIRMEKFFLSFNFLSFLSLSLTFIIISSSNIVVERRICLSSGWLNETFFFFVFSFYIIAYILTTQCEYAKKRRNFFYELCEKSGFFELSSMLWSRKWLSMCLDERRQKECLWKSIFFFVVQTFNFLIF